jgi:hypothetical protein
MNHSLDIFVALIKFILLITQSMRLFTKVESQISCFISRTNKYTVLIIEVGWRLTFVEVFSTVFAMLGTFYIFHGINSDNIYLCPGQLLPVIFSCNN